MNFTFDFNELYNYLNIIIFWNSIKEYIISLFILLLVIIFIRVFRLILLKKLQSYADYNPNKFTKFAIEALQSIPTYFYWVLYLYLPLKYLTLSYFFENILDVLILIVIILQLIKVAIKFIQFILRKSLLDDDESKDNITTYNLLLLVAKIIITVTALLFVLINLWFEITPLLASLWVWWIAIAFALQNVLQDIFSSISIYLDKPFKIWDFISVWWDFWTVQKIWIKTTRLKTLQWQQLIVSNREMTNARVNNFWVMETRRIVFSFWVTYETSLEKLKKIPDIVKSIFEREELNWTELSRVHFKEFWDFSLNYEVVYTVNISDFNTFMDAQQFVNFELIEIFRNEWIEFAYPTQVIYKK